MKHSIFLKNARLINGNLETNGGITYLIKTTSDHLLKTWL